MITDEKKLFTDEVVQAILKRKEKVNKTVIIVSKLMEVYGMSAYTKIAERLILDKKGSEKLFEEHVTLDFLTGDIWLDEVALYYYSDILEGFIESEKLKAFMEYIDSCENLNRINNQSIQMYREKNFIELFKTMRYHNRYKKSLPFEVKLIKKWCMLELLSRTALPRIYYSIKELPLNIKVKYISNRIKRDILAELR